MNLAGGGQVSIPGTAAAATVHSYIPAKRSHSAQSSISTSDLRELTNTLQELNNQFKRNVKVLTEIKDYMVKVCEKQETRPVDDNSGVHKLERVRSECEEQQTN